MPAQGSAPRGCSCTELCHCVLQAAWHQGIGTFLLHPLKKTRPMAWSPKQRTRTGCWSTMSPRKRSAGGKKHTDCNAAGLPCSKPCLLLVARVSSPPDPHIIVPHPRPCTFSSSLGHISSLPPGHTMCPGGLNCTAGELGFAQGAQRER